jgi:hypothetical protein
MVTGDLNFHLDNTQDSDTRKFLELVEDRGMSQHVSPTHIQGHIQDVIITKMENPVLRGSPQVLDPGLCDNKGNSTGDHLATRSLLNLAKPPRERKIVTFRKLSSINITQFVSDLNASSALRILDRSTDELVDSYNEILIQTMDNHAPARSKEITVRPNTQWFTDELLAAKRIRRQTERTMK